MSRLTPQPFRNVKKALRKAGFQPVRQKGSHVFFRHEDGRAVVVPKHPGEDIRPGLLRKIIRDAEMDRKEFLRLL